jgi:hypothetical protein
MALALAGALPSCCGGSSEGATRSSESNWVSVGVSAHHSCGLRTDGSVECWGCVDVPDFAPNDHGQCDAPPGEFRAVSVSNFRSCALGLDDSVTCWGKADEERSSEDKFRLLQDGVWASFAIDGNGKVHDWDCVEEAPGDCSPTVPGLTDISVGMDHACGIDSGGVPTCWGCTMRGMNQGQCSPPSAAFSEIDSYLTTNCGVRLDGNIHCWGQTTGVVSGSFIDVAVGGFFSCGIRSDNTLLCWNYTPSVTYEPHEEMQFFRDVSIGLSHACGVTMDGSILCWGSESEEKLDVP